MTAPQMSPVAVKVEHVYTFELPDGQNEVLLDSSKISGTITTLSDGTKKFTEKKKPAPKKPIIAKKRKIVWRPASSFI